MQWKPLIWGLGCLLAVACANDSTSLESANTGQAIDLRNLEEIGGTKKYIIEIIFRVWM